MLPWIRKKEQSRSCANLNTPKWNNSVMFLTILMPSGKKRPYIIKPAFFNNLNKPAALGPQIVFLQWNSVSDFYFPLSSSPTFPTKRKGQYNTFLQERANNNKKFGHDGHLPVSATIKGSAINAKAITLNRKLARIATLPFSIVAKPACLRNASFNGTMILAERFFTACHHWTNKRA